MKRKASYLLFFLAACCLAQTAKTQVIDSMLAVYADQYPVEKMHIHFDKAMYNKEETIFYKVYLLSGTELSQLSKNVYVEWYDTSGRMLKQTVAPLQQSTAKGSFDLPDNYTGNFIRVKAYTRWMLNDDPAFSYERELTINTAIASPARKPVVYRTKLETFPEGGNLVYGLRTRVAFKATNQYGNPVFIKAFLVNDKNKVLDTLKVQHDGMGSFYLKANAQEKYQINWTDEYGKTGTTPIQSIKNEGVRLTISTTNEKAKVQVERTAGVPESFKRMNLLVHMNQNILYKVSMTAIEKTLLNAEIPIDELPTGVVQFSLFSADWIPLAERIIFVNNHLHEFNAKLTQPLLSLQKRGKNVFEVYVTDTAATSMSLSITDAAAGNPSVHTIFSDVLLSSEIRGKVYNPGYYLMSDADSVTANLDLVLLTNGWRRFDWDKIKAGITPNYQYPRETDFMKVSGKVYGAKQVAGSTLLLNLILVKKDSSKNFLFVPVERDGSFEQKGLYFYDTARVYYSFNGNDKLTDVTTVQFENGLLRQTPKKISLGDINTAFLFSDSLARVRMNEYLQQQELLKRQMASTTLQEVVVKARKKQPEQILDERYASGLFSGGDAQIFDFVNDPAGLGATDILSYLQGRVAGLQISGSGTAMSMNWRGASPDLYLNESPVGVDLIQTVNVRDIAMVKVFRPPFFGSISGGAGGAIAIYTKKGNDSRSADPKAKGLANTILGGYSRFKEFYNPSYDKPAENFETDIRSTLYWNPYLITNKKSPRVRIQFYNNDISKKFLAVLEGVNSEGKMTRVVQILE
jgi:hypothetical protein